MLLNAQRFSHQLLQECLTSGSVAVDATSGNGYDTLFLCELVGDEGKVYACDIQSEALKQTQKRLNQHHNTTPTVLIEDSHANLSRYIDTSINAAIFNLGYLPGSDKKNITRPDSTIQALQALQPLLVSGGRIIIVCYWGHDGGLEEKDALEKYLPTLPQKEWTTLRYEFLNQKHCPPVLFVIEKK